MLKRLISDYKNYIWIFVLSLLCAVVSTCLSLFVPILMGQGMDMIVGANNVDFDGLIVVIRKMAVAIMLSALFLWFMNGLNNRIVYGISSDLRQRAFKSFVDCKLQFVDEHSEGDVISRIIVDADGVSDGLLLGFNQFFIGIVTIIITLIFMIRVNVILAIAVVILTPLSIFVARFIATRCNVYFDKQAKARAFLTDVSSDIIAMKQVINYEGAEDYFKKRFDNVNGNVEEASRRATYYSSLTNPMTRLVNAICYALMTLLGAYFALEGSITIGGLTSFLAYASQFAKPFNDISSVVTELQNSVVCLGRIYELIDTPSERSELTVTDETSLDNVNGITNYDITFDKVSFGYNEKDVITDITFTIPNGKKMGIVGASGCGKTTIMKLLLKYYNYGGGRISIGGTDIKDMSVDELRSMMGLMLQEPFLINGTVLDNILMGNVNSTRQDAINAAKECYAHDFIMNLYNGYDSIVTDENLSEGQKQLICITRLMLRDSKVVLLDEATSSIDVLNEQLIQKAFDKIMSGKTTIVVAHRLSTVKDADIIMVIDGGQIKELGSHSELIANKGLYYKLYNAQSIDDVQKLA